MKTIFLAAVFLYSALGAGTAQTDVSQIGTSNTWVVTYHWTGDSVNGSVPSTNVQLTCCQGFLPVQVETVPGSPQPTSGYSVAINDAAGVDILNGAAGSLSASAGQSFAAAASAPPIQGTITLVITGQSIASAKGTVYVFLSKPGTISLAALRGGGGSSANWLTLANSPFVDARSFCFTPQSPGGSLVSGVTNTIRWKPVPGVSALDPAHWLYISGGSGTAEPVLITGGTGGTLQFTPTHNHTGNWSVQSATGCMQEALSSASILTGVTVLAPFQATIHAPIYIPAPPSSGFDDQALPRFSLTGTSNMTSTITMAPDYPLTASGMITYGAGFAGSLKDITLISAGQPDSTSFSDYIAWPAAIDARNQPVYGNVENVDILNAWIGVDCSAGLACSGFAFTNMHTSGYINGWLYGAGGADFVRMSQIYVGPNINGTFNNRVVHDQHDIAFQAAGGFYTVSNLQTTNLNVSVAVSGGNVNISTLQCDSGSCLNISGGTTFVNNGFSSMALGTNYFVHQTGGGLWIQDYFILKPEASTGPIVQISGTNVTTDIRRLFFETGGFDTPFLTDSATSSTLLVHDVIYNDTNASPAGPFLTFTSSDITFGASGNVMPVRATVNPAAKFLSFAGSAASLTSAAWLITGNFLYGWNIDAPNPVNHIQQPIITDNVGLDDQEPTISAVSGVLNFPTGYSQFLLTGTASITKVTGLYPGRKILLLTDQNVPFVGGGSSNIGQSFTSTSGVPVVGFTATNGLLWLK